MSGHESASDQKISYALKDNKLVHISEVRSGLRCGCRCVVCHRKLIAKKGENRIHHFAHESEAACANAAETILHLLAKELIADFTSILLPQYIFLKESKLKNGLMVKHESIVVKGGVANISSVLIEQPENRFIPDVTVFSSSKKLFIEIAVTHHVNRAKLRKIRKADIPAIEIKLDHSDAMLSREALSIKLQSDLPSKKWLFHPKQRVAEKVYFENLRNEIRNAKKTSGHLWRKVADSHIVERHYFNSNNIDGFSIADEDRLLFDFYLAHKRQASSLEEAFIWLRSIVNASTESQSSISTYAQVKGKWY